MNAGRDRGGQPFLPALEVFRDAEMAGLFTE